MGARPKLSVIIPTTRPLQVKRTVRSLARQDGGLDFEVIIQKAGGLNPAQARNRGAKKARGRYLFFIDDDCEADQAWLRSGLVVLKRSGVGLVGGLVSSPGERYWERVVDLANFTRVQGEEEHGGPVYGASMAIKRSFFNALGGFDERLRVGEDVDLCLRVEQAGKKVVYESKMGVVHDHRRQTLKEVWQYHFFNGSRKGFVLERRYRDRNLWQVWAKLGSHPFLFGLLVPVLALVATFRSFWFNRYQNISLSLWPGVFIAKLGCQVGMWSWAWKNRPQSGWRRGWQYWWRARFVKKPSVLTLFVTNGCNARCQHCFYWQNLAQERRDLSLAQIKLFSQELGRLDQLYLTGGEPFLRSDLAQLVEVFWRKNKLGGVALVTNGLAPQRISAQVAELVEISPRLTVSVCLSLDGPPSVHDRVRGVPGAFNQVQETFQGLSLLQDQYPNLDLRFNTTVTSFNYRALRKLVAGFTDWFGSRARLSLSLLRGLSKDPTLKLPSANQLKSLFRYKWGCLGQDWRASLSERLVFAAQLKVIQGKRLPWRCSAGRLAAVVVEDGRKRVCELKKPIVKKDWFFSKRGGLPDRRCVCTQEGMIFLNLLASPWAWIGLLWFLRRTR